MLHHASLSSIHSIFLHYIHSLSSDEVLALLYHFRYIYHHHIITSYFIIHHSCSTYSLFIWLFSSDELLSQADNFRFIIITLSHPISLCITHHYSLHHFITFIHSSTTMFQTLSWSHGDWRATYFIMQHYVYII